jgi:hypothetical protein
LTLNHWEVAEKMVSMSASPSAAKACPENRPVIAAVNRCATQIHVLNRLFSAACWGAPLLTLFEKWLAELLAW